MQSNVTHLDFGKSLVDPATESGFGVKTRHSFGPPVRASPTFVSNRRVRKFKKIKCQPEEQCETHTHKRVLTNLMPLEWAKRVRNSDLTGNQTPLGLGFGHTPDVSRNKKGNLLMLDEIGTNTLAVKPKHRKLIEVTEVSDLQPIQYGNLNNWETIHNGILKQDMAGQRIKVENGYQYELGSKFPL